MAEPFTLMTLLKLPFALIWKGMKWTGAFFTAPARLRKLEAAAVSASDPRPACPSCGEGRVGAFHYVPGDKDHNPKTYGLCSSKACQAEWLLTHDGSKLRRLSKDQVLDTPPRP